MSRPIWSTAYPVKNILEKLPDSNEILEVTVPAIFNFLIFL